MLLFDAVARDAPDFCFRFDAVARNTLEMRVMDVPHLPYDILLREQLTSKPAVVKTDEDLDVEEAVAIHARARESGSASSAGPARGKGRGKGRGRGRGRVVQVPDDAVSSEMGSASD